MTKDIDRHFCKSQWQMKKKYILYIECSADFNMLVNTFDLTFMIHLGRLLFLVTKNNQYL